MHYLNRCMSVLSTGCGRQQLLGVPIGGEEPSHECIFILTYQH